VSTAARPAAAASPSLWRQLFPSPPGPAALQQPDCQVIIVPAAAVAAASARCPPPLARYGTVCLPAVRPLAVGATARAPGHEAGPSSGPAAASPASLSRCCGGADLWPQPARLSAAPVAAAAPAETDSVEAVLAALEAEPEAASCGRTRRAAVADDLRPRGGASPRSPPRRAAAGPGPTATAAPGGTHKAPAEAAPAEAAPEAPADLDPLEAILAALEAVAAVPEAVACARTRRAAEAVPPAGGPGRARANPAVAEEDELELLDSLEAVLAALEATPEVVAACARSRRALEPPSGPASRGGGGAHEAAAGRQLLRRTRSHMAAPGVASSAAAAGGRARLRFARRGAAQGCTACQRRRLLRSCRRVARRWT
jgi:hypothetical protein